MGMRESYRALHDETAQLWCAGNERHDRSVDGFKRPLPDRAYS
jgi:hypothetical protein